MLVSVMESNQHLVRALELGSVSEMMLEMGGGWANVQGWRLAWVNAMKVRVQGFVLVTGSESGSPEEWA